MRLHALAGLTLQIAPSNKKRHATLQRLLLTDPATIAVEVPISPTPDDFTYFQGRGFTSPFGNNPIAGHIDFLQLRSGFLHILDYEPEVRKEEAHRHLTDDPRLDTFPPHRSAGEGLRVRLVRRARLRRIFSPAEPLSTTIKHARHVCLGR
jgi:hypothetical protein